MSLLLTALGLLAAFVLCALALLWHEGSRWGRKERRCADRVSRPQSVWARMARWGEW